MPLSFMTDSVTVIRAPLITVNGGQVRNWAGASTHMLSRIQITAQSTSRDFDGRVTQVTDMRRLRAPYDADIQPGDRVQWHGETYEVNGEVFHTKSPTGRVSSTRCTLVRWEG